jgi:type I restriction enzyme S subunit
VPFEVPESWEWVKISDIGDWQSGATPSRANKEYFNGEILWLKTGDLNDNYVCDIPETITEKALLETSLKINPIGSVLIAMYGATIGKVGILTKPATTNQACCACSNFRGINNLFLFYTLIAYRGYFIGISEGGAQPNISKIKITSTYIPLPPIEEQHRIVREIKRLFELIDTIEENKLSLEDLIVQTKSKILNLAIRGKLVPQNYSDEPAITLLEQIKKRNKSHKTTTDTSHYPFEIPNGWEVTEMQNICSLLDGEKRNDLSLPYLDVKFLRNQSGINFKKSGKFVSAETNLVLVDGENSGEIFKTNINGYQGSTLKIIQISEEINEEYIFYILKKEHKLFKESKTGSAIPHLNKKLFREYPIPLPPLAEQQRIVFQIEKIFAQLEIIENSLKA